MPPSESWPAAAGAAFLLLVGGYFLASFGRQLLRMWGSRNWVETPCEVLSIRDVGVEDFAIEISYAYVVGGTTYRSDRLCFAANLAVTDGHAILGRNSPGSAGVCYVNPADPADPVFVRSVNVVPAAVLFATGVAVAGSGVYLAVLWATGKIGPG